MDDISALPLYPECPGRRLQGGRMSLLLQALEDSHIFRILSTSCGKKLPFASKRRILINFKRGGVGHLQLHPLLKYEPFCPHLLN
jgi:hypothetical protein